MSGFAAVPESMGFLLGLGVAAGVISALLGIGSGVLLVPALVLLAGLPQKSAQGTALAVMVPMALVGCMRYAANPDVTIALPRVLLLSLGAVVGAVVGAAIASRVPAVVLRRLFAAVLIIVAVRMMLGSGKPKGVPSGPSASDAAETSPGGGGR